MTSMGLVAKRSAPPFYKMMTKANVAVLRFHETLVVQERCKVLKDNR
jgi:hypothetical protein